eukprot:8385454-Pyramimonas_sp.AAC.1
MVLSEITSRASRRPSVYTLAEAAKEIATLSAVPSALETASSINDHNLQTLTCRWARSKMGNIHSFASGTPKQGPATRERVG